MKKYNFKYLLWAIITALSINLLPFTAIYAEGEESNRIVRTSNQSYATTVEVRYSIYNRSLDISYEHILTSDEIMGDIDSTNVKNTVEKYTSQIKNEIGKYETHADAVSDIVDNVQTVVTKIDEATTITGKKSDGTEEVIKADLSELNELYPNYDGVFYVNTAQTKHQKYTVVHTSTVDYQLINDLDVTVAQPTVGTEITRCEEHCTNEQTNTPVVPPSESIKVESGNWVTKESNYNEKYYGTIEKDSDYYAFLNISTEHGFMFGDTPNITANGEKPYKNLGFRDNLAVTIVVKVLSTIQPSKYTILYGANQTYQKEDVVIKTSGDLEKLRDIMLNGAKLSPDFYSLASGSTILTIKSSYLDTLSAGTYTVTFVYEDGEVETSLIIPEGTSTPVDEPTTPADEPTTPSQDPTTTGEGGTDDDQGNEEEPTVVPPAETETTQAAETTPKTVTISKSTNIKNPQTSDNIQANFAIFLLSIVGFLGATITISKQK